MGFKIWTNAKSERIRMKPKIYFIIPTLFAGGAERIISFVAENLSNDKFYVKLIVIGFEKESKYDVSNTNVLFMNKSRVLFAIFPIIKILIKEKPEIMVSSISHLNTMMGLISILFRKTIFVGRHSTISKIAKNFKTNKTKPWLLFFEPILSYGTRNLDYIICQSSDMKNDFLESYKYNKDNVWVIRNPITKMETYKTNNRKSNSKVKKLITIGRFRKIKGQLRLLDVLSKLKTPFEFTIIGEGEYKERIFNKIKELKLEHKINYVNHTNNVYEHLIKHDIFLQGSYSEGFPNTLLESCVVGTPVIAFNAPGGTKEIVDNGINGYIVNSEEEFLEKLNEVKIWDPKIVSNSVYKKFSKEKILNDFEVFFFHILKK